MCYNIIEDKKMKLNSVELKKLILEVMEEATRRDFLKGLAGAAGLAAQVELAISMPMKIRMSFKECPSEV
jgi:hypothetical protein